MSNHEARADAGSILRRLITKQTISVNAGVL